MAGHLGIVLTGRGDSGSLPQYQHLAGVLAGKGMRAEIVDSWMDPADLELNEAGVPIYNVGITDIYRAIADRIEENDPDEVTLVGFCAGAEAALRFRRRWRINRVVAISPSTWFRFPKPYDHFTAMAKAKAGRKYTPLIRRRHVSDPYRMVTYVLDPMLFWDYTSDLRRQLSNEACAGLVGPFYARRDWYSPAFAFIALGADTVCPAPSVRWLYEMCESPKGNGYIEMPGLGHDYGYSVGAISRVGRAVERCLEGGNFDERW